MPSELRHDTARALAHHIVELFQGCLREEELADAFHEVYLQTMAALEVYDGFVHSLRGSDPSVN
jgi:hypothetical protein